MTDSKKNTEAEAFLVTLNQLLSNKSVNPIKTVSQLDLLIAKPTVFSVCRQEKGKGESR